MKKFLTIGFIFTCLIGSAGEASAAWMWTPESGKWFNIKKNSKDTPEEQFAWAMGFYNERIRDAVKKEFEIANEFASGTKMKIWGIPALSGQDKAVELYKHIVKNA